MWAIWPRACETRIDPSRCDARTLPCKEFPVNRNSVEHWRHTRSACAVQSPPATSARSSPRRRRVMRPSRRRFLTSAAAGGTLLGLSDLGFLSGLPPVGAADAKPDPKRVRLRPEIEPLVQLIEETPRAQLLEEVADRIKKGLTYQDVLTGLMLAGVCNVEPRPNVGFKFHAVLVVNSAHLASLASPDSERWLPMFWALDNFKSAQAQNEKERNGWRMQPVAEDKVPTARNARQAFIDAMDRWDTEAADAAVAGLARHAGAQEAFELFVKYGARDFRDIGHKAIFVANSWRTLQTAGWHHAEPVLRSLAYALLKY